ncbi:MAG: elongation factor G [Acidobacteriota bacterium]|jgi:elongation factor G
MQVESPQRIRNVAVAGHSDTGKTTLVSALLYTSGATSRQTKVDDGNTVTDFDSQEIERGISIGLSTAFAPWRKHKVNLLDCPGYGIFFNETRAGMRAADSVVLCVNAVAGIEVNTEKVWATAEEMELPLVFRLTKMDRERADFDRVVEALQTRFGRTALPIQIPIGAEQEFDGVVDLVHEKAYRFERDGNGKAEESDVPADLADTVAEWRERLMEVVAESDMELMEKYLEEGEISQEEFEAGLAAGIRQRELFPVTMGSDLHMIGASSLLDLLVDELPSPADRQFPATTLGDEELGLDADPEAPFAALVFKTTGDPLSGKISLLRVVSGTLASDSSAWNSRLEDTGKVGTLMHMEGKNGEAVPSLVAGDIGGVAKLKNTATGDTLAAKDRPVRLAWIDVPEPAMAFAVEPESKADEEKIGEALSRLTEEDPTLHVSRDPDTHEYLLSGAGQLHIEIAVAKLKERYKVNVLLHQPKVPYRETIKRPADGHGRHKKQSGGRGQFADCKIKMEPLSRGGDFEFLDEIFGGSIPQTYRPAVEKGIQEARAKGYLAGFPVVDFRVRLIDGQYHDVDSSEMAFKIAGSLAFKDAMTRASATILEPIMLVEVTAPDDMTGDIMSDLSQRRGRPQGMEAGAGNGTQLIKATVPMAEMLDYAPSLRSMTQGRASFHIEFSHYDEVPKQLQEKIIQEAEQAKEEGG